MSIPVARGQLNELAKLLESGQCGPIYGARLIREIVEEQMFRAPPGKPRAPRKIAPLTPVQVHCIKEQVKLRPDMSLLEIAKMFSTNPGRVSEAINGKV